MNFSLPRLRIGFTRIQQRFTTLLAVTICLAIVACSATNHAVSQENTPVDYRVEWISMPPETSGAYVNELAMFTDSNGAAEIAFVVGSQTRSDRTDRSAYIYDHFGTIDPSKVRYFYDIEDDALDVSFPPSWLPDAIGSSFVSVNSSGHPEYKDPTGRPTGGSDRCVCLPTFCGPL